MTKRMVRPVSDLDATLRPPGSRSLTNRALVVAALAAGTSEIVNPLDADDTRAMRGALRSLGVRIDDDRDDVWMVHGTGGALAPAEPVIDVLASGTTARFVTALATLADGTVVIDGTERMRQRPIAHLLDALTSLGANVEAPTGCPPVTVRGTGLAGGQVNVDATASSQYASALMMLSPLCAGVVTIDLVGEQVVSRRYLEMTSQVMEAFGVDVAWDSSRAISITPASYRPTRFEVEPDASSAVYLWVAAAVTGGRATVEGIPPTSRQADVGVLEHLRAMGCDVEHDDQSATVHGSHALRPLEADLNETPDGAMALAVAAAFAAGASRLSNLANLRIKESDRLGGLTTELSALGAPSTHGDDWIQVEGGGPLRSAVVDSRDDHRIAMSLALAGLRVPGVAIDGAECVNKTWPGFFDVLGEFAPPLVIAIDGPGGVGKSTVSTEVATLFGFAHLDTGAFYRAATLLALRGGVDVNAEDAVYAIAEASAMTWAGGRMAVDGEDVTEAIRSAEVTANASAVAAHPRVRALLVARQQAWVAEHKGRAVVEGRDIGTVVFPDAAIKVFLTADAEVRAARRAVQDQQAVAAVTDQLSERDRLDSSRAASPLRAADDAALVDTSNMTIDEVVEHVAGLVVSPSG